VSSSTDSDPSTEQYIPVYDSCNLRTLSELPTSSTVFTPVVEFPVIPEAEIRTSTLPLPCITSTPNSSITKRTGTTEVSGCKVKMSINYACKTVNKILDVRYEALGKALFHGPPSRIATAVIKCEPVRKEVVKKILGIVKNEVDDLCSRQKPSMLRKSGKDDLMKFDLQLLCQEWMSKAPLFYSFLLTCASSKNTSNTTLNWFPSIAVAGSVLLKQRNKAMSATANVLGILLKTKSIEVYSVLVN